MMFVNLWFCYETMHIFTNHHANTLPTCHLLEGTLKEKRKFNRRADIPSMHSTGHALNNFPNLTFNNIKTIYFWK